tara:strand:+ start:45002 stop:45157 length:156 start_codon:yes stop_codon:yes gene_type:complete
VRINKKDRIIGQLYTKSNDLNLQFAKLQKNKALTNPSVSNLWVTTNSSAFL